MHHTRPYSRYKPKYQTVRHPLFFVSHRRSHQFCCSAPALDGADNPLKQLIGRQQYFTFLLDQILHGLIRLEQLNAQIPVFSHRLNQFVNVSAFMTAKRNHRICIDIKFAVQKVGSFDKIVNFYDLLLEVIYIAPLPDMLHEGFHPAAHIHMILLIIILIVLITVAIFCDISLDGLLQFIHRVLYKLGGFVLTVEFLNVMVTFLNQSLQL